MHEAVDGAEEAARGMEHEAWSNEAVDGEDDAGLKHEA